MKMVITYLRPEQLPDIRDALFHAGINHLTASTVMGTAPKTEQQMFRGVAREVSLFRRVRVDVIVDDEKLDQTIDAITIASKESGGYGKIFVTEVLDAIKPYSGERGVAAL